MTAPGESKRQGLHDSLLWQKNKKVFFPKCLDVRGKYCKEKAARSQPWLLKLKRIHIIDGKKWQ